MSSENSDLILKKFEDIGPNQDDKYYCIDSNGIIFKVGDKLSIGQIGKAYSQHVKKTSLPFKFEGMEIPSSISGRYLFSENNIYW